MGEVCCGLNQLTAQTVVVQVMPAQINTASGPVRGLPSIWPSPSGTMTFTGKDSSSHLWSCPRPVVTLPPFVILNLKGSGHLQSNALLYCTGDILLTWLDGQEETSK